MPKAICRFDVEALNCGLDNEINLERIQENDTAGANVFSLLVGRVFSDGSKYSYFKKDRLEGNTNLLDKILKEEKHVEAGRVDEEGTFFMGVYVPYDIQELPCLNPTLDCMQPFDCMLELMFVCDENKKYVYIDVEEIPADKVNIMTFVSEYLEDFFIDAAEQEKYGLKFDSDDSRCDEYTEITAMFSDPAGYNIELNFETVYDFASHLLSARFIKK